MLPVTVDPASGTPPFEQLRRQVAAMVAEGTLSPGSRMPTVRRLAADLGLAANTVARAYRELEAAGLLETRGRAGTFVGSNGDDGRARAAAAATEYVRVIDVLGISRVDGLAIVRAALDN